MGWIRATRCFLSRSSRRTSSQRFWQCKLKWIFFFFGIWPFYVYCQTSHRRFTSEDPNVFIWQNVLTVRIVFGVLWTKNGRRLVELTKTSNNWSMSHLQRILAQEFFSSFQTFPVQIFHKFTFCLFSNIDLVPGARSIMLFVKKSDGGPANFIKTAFTYGNSDDALIRVHGEVNEVGILNQIFVVLSGL